MQFGAMNFPVLPVLDEIKAFAGMGFDYLELAMDPPMAHHSILARQHKDIVMALRDNGLGLVCHLPTFVTTADLTESLRRASLGEMHHSMEVAAALGAAKVVLHPSMVVGMGPLVLATVKEYAFDFLSQMVTAADALGVVVCLENMFPRNLLGVEADDFTEIFRVFPNLKMTLDTGHANIDDRRGLRLSTLVQRFATRIGHLHCSDNQGQRDDHLAIGSGTVNFRKLVGDLKAIGYDDTLTLEVFEKDRNLLVASRERLRHMWGQA
jgi:sugar phosphate isomerase/epimerase